MSVQAKPKPDPVCARCRLPITDGEHVVFEAAEPIHTECIESIDRLVEMAAAFLRRRADGAICRPCLGRALGITSDDTRKTTNALRLTGDYDVVVGGRCGVCRQPAACIEPSAGPERWPLAS